MKGDLVSLKNWSMGANMARSKPRLNWPALGGSEIESMPRE